MIVGNDRQSSADDAPRCRATYDMSARVLFETFQVARHRRRLCFYLVSNYDRATTLAVPKPYARYRPFGGGKEGRA